MKTLLSISILFFSLSSFAARSLPGFTSVGTKEIQESDVTFRYQSNDGTFDLECAHVFDSPEAHDWDVWCGKGSGTNLLRQFRVHFMVRALEHRTLQKSAYEVLYWVIDRNAKKPQFDSTSTWLQFNNLSKLEVMSFSQGVENDYAMLTVTFKPRQ
jgi:hypothetical protein